MSSLLYSYCNLDRLSQKVNGYLNQSHFELSDSEARVVVFGLELYQNMAIQSVVLWPILVVLRRVINIP